MPPFYGPLRDRLARDGALAMATVIDRCGAAPCEVGAKMVVCRHGETAGSIADGRGDGRVWHDALGVLRSGRPMIARIDITGRRGGRRRAVVEVLVERLAMDEAPAAGGPTAGVLLERLVQAELAREPAVVATVVGGEAAPVGSRLVALGGGEWLGPAAPWVLDLEGPVAETLATGRTRRIRLLGDASLDVFLESLRPAPDLVLVGTGHVARPLAAIGKALGFEVTVLDDLADPAVSAGFPGADRVIAGDLGTVLASHPIGRGSYVVCATHGHHLDAEILEAFVRSDAEYVGVIGSRHQIDVVVDRLRSAGVPEGAIARLHAPVDRDAWADTPAEIAVAVAAEIVNVRRARHAASAGGRPRPLPV